MVNKKRVGLGAGALAAAALAAGYYFYASKDAPKHRRVAARWAGGLKKEALQEIKQLKKMDRAQVMKAIDAATAAYETARTVDRTDVLRAATELKNNWREIVSEAIGTGAATAKKAASKPTKSSKKRASRVNE